MCIGDMSHVWDHAQWLPSQILSHFDPSLLSVCQLTGKLGFSASHWLFRPIRGLRDVSHVWDHANWISKILFSLPYDKKFAFIFQTPRGIINNYFFMLNFEI